MSERVPGEDLFVIKGSGVEYDELERIVEANAEHVLGP